MRDPRLACELCDRSGPAVPHFPSVGIVRCPSCDLVYYEQSSALPPIYTEEYFKGGEYLDYAADREILQRNFAERVKHLRRLERRLNPGAGERPRLLELGCAYGFFLDLAQRHWDARGVDVAREPIEHARARLGLDVRLGEFLELPDEPSAYDVVCLWDTIEHLPRPVETIEKAARWLKPGGLLAMTTGDVSSFVARFRGVRWRLVHPPSHLYYFSPATLGRAARRAGLEVKHVSHPGYTRSVRFILHSICVNRLGARRLYELLTLGGRLDFPLYTNTYDIMMLVAQKPAEPSATA